MHAQGLDLLDRKQAGDVLIVTKLGRLKVCLWPILLKNSAMVCASGKYVSEIEIFTFGRGFRTRISRSSVQKRHFHQSMIRPFGQSDFFNRIGRKQPVKNLEQGRLRLFALTVVACPVLLV
ncbi:hypothetical protein AUC60_02810 [Pseudomonas caspiana]|uniref:Uncharacterized protein n=1 Tax=Pseudomonas caspiana TaxID=1451454 RepID=A0A1Y3P5Q4_9PSED|nr:hypothetical protein AUC60_02810 [Pseudomonas caspiana]